MLLQKIVFDFLLIFPRCTAIHCNHSEYYEENDSVLMDNLMGQEAVLGIQEGDRIKCTACARYCKIPAGKIGFCGVRGNIEGKLYLFSYGKVIVGNIDPIEKKPVSQFMPGSLVYSIGTTGCNWMCRYCQNFDISQRKQIVGVSMTPDEVVRTAITNECRGIAYTYNEPSIFIEFARDCGVIARENELFNVFVSNGYSTPESVRMMNEFLDCITIDFKGNGEKYFNARYAGIPDPKPIYETIKEIRDRTNIHIEITDLIVPRVGDDLDEAKNLAKFVHDELGPQTPIHFLRFHPDYKMMELPPTPIETLEKHYMIAKGVGLEYVYLGNVPGHKWEHTYCPACKSVAVQRFGHTILSWNLDKNNCCESCGHQIAITNKTNGAQRKILN
jgi:pyruvate formate lyase activating enzyme